MFVLTNVQLNQAIVLGAVQLGAVDAVTVKALTAAPGSLRLTRTANGYVVVDSSGATPVVSSQPAPAAAKPGRKPAAPAQTTVTPAVAGSTVDDGPPAATVKAALVAGGMANPPGLNSINTWDATQKRAAMRWAKDMTKPRPDFIKERAQRGSKGATATPAPSSAAKAAPANGAGGESGFEFFEEPDAGSAPVAQA